MNFEISAFDCRNDDEAWYDHFHKVYFCFLVVASKFKIIDFEFAISNNGCNHTLIGLNAKSINWRFHGIFDKLLFSLFRWWYRMVGNCQIWLQYLYIEIFVKLCNSIKLLDKRNIFAFFFFLFRKHPPTTNRHKRTFLRSGRRVRVSKN